MSLSTRSPHSQVFHAYLKALELELKQRQGLPIEEILIEVNAHLHDVYIIDRRLAGRESDDILKDIQASFGTPAQIADAWETTEGQANWLERNLAKIGHAPGWRVSCTSCGRSKPASSTGMIRIGATSHQKYILGWCKNCRWLRWIRVSKDLEKASLTEHIPHVNSGNALRSRFHNYPFIHLATGLAIFAFTFWLVRLCMLVIIN